MLTHHHARSSSTLSRARAVALALLLLPAACADEQATEPESDAESGLPELAAEQAAIASGTREVLVGGIPSAENMLFTRSGRLLVSGDQGIYEVTRGATGSVSARNLHPGETCKFGGMAQLGEHIYANCQNGARSSIFAAAEDTLDFVSIAQVQGLANGMAADEAAGHLYVTTTTQGKLLRLALSPTNPRVVASQEVVRSGVLMNGLKIFDGHLYWGEYLLVGTIRRVPLARIRGAASVIVSRTTFFDDFEVDAEGIVAADFFADAVRSFDPSGKPLEATRSQFRGASSVLRARGRLGLGERDLVITEKGGNLVSVYRTP